MRPPLSILKATVGITAILAFPFVSSVRADDADPRLRVLDCVGQVSAYRDETEESARLRIDQHVDDGDRIITGPKSEAILRLKNRLYLHLAPNTRLSISRLRFDESKGLTFRVTLLEGKMVAQMDQIPNYPFEIYAGDVLCRAHGTLVEVVKRGDQVRIYSHQGAFVVSSRGHTEIAKKGQVVSCTAGKFKDKSSISIEDEADLTEWRDHLHDIRTGHPHGRP
jgi:ferric-dicitrate binding protein FerR (iron transport regulator)